MVLDVQMWLTSGARGRTVCDVSERIREGYTSSEGRSKSNAVNAARLRRVDRDFTLLDCLRDRVAVAPRPSKSVLCHEVTLLHFHEPDGKLGRSTRAAKSIGHSSIPSSPRPNKTSKSTSK